MSECHLLCNIVKCRKELKTQAWVTSCSHTFCMNHGQNAVEKEKCSVCETTFSGKYDIVVMDLNPPEQYKNMVLAGFSPEKVFDIANRALIFWNYQMYQDRLFRDSEVRAAKQHSAEISDYCESIILKHKMEIQKLDREIQGYQKEIEEKMRQSNDLIILLQDKSKLIKNLQSQNSSLKRDLANYMRPNDNDQVDIDAERANHSKYSFSISDSENRRRYDRYDPQNRNNGFVFEPNITPNSPQKRNFKFI